MDYPQFVDIYQYLYRNRIMLVGNFIDEEVSNQMIATLLWLKTQEPRDKPITIYFNVAGCLLYPGLAVFDTIRDLQSTTTVNTLNIGLAVGMGAILCGTGDLRMALPNARYLLQKTGKEDPVSGQAIDVALEVAQCAKANDRLSIELSKLTGQPLPKIEKDLERDFYLDAAEAVQYGLIDQVLLPKRKEPRKRHYSDLPDSFGMPTTFKEVIAYGAFADASEKSSLSGGGWSAPDDSGPEPMLRNPLGQKSDAQIGSLLLGLNQQIHGGGSDDDEPGFGKFDKNGPYPEEGEKLIL